MGVADLREGFNGRRVFGSLGGDRRCAGVRRLPFFEPLLERLVFFGEFFPFLVVPEGEPAGNHTEEEECSEKGSDVKGFHGRPRDECNFTSFAPKL